LGLRDDLIHQSHLQQIGRGQPQSSGRLLRVVTIAPQYRRAALGRDNRIDSVLEHQHLVPDPDSQSAPRAALSRDGYYDWHAQPRHLAQVIGDGFSLAPFLGVDARISSGGVHESEDRAVELLRKLHNAKRLAIAFRFWHAKIPLFALPGRAAFLVAYDDAMLSVEARESRYDGRIIRESTISVDFGEPAEDQVYIVQRIGPVFVARQLDPFPRAERSRVPGQIRCLRFLDAPVQLLHRQLGAVRICP